MSAPHTEGARPGPVHARDDASVGQLLGDLTGDLARLFRDEVELAKAEVKEEAAKAGKAAGLYGGAAYAVGLAVLLASLAAVFGLRHVMDIAWAALVVTAVWAVIGAVLHAMGRTRMRTVQPTPERAVDSLKKDAKWARHPTS
ncbi:phage holin family protein [Streptomyces silaceus]|uniref:phage holin family protein n=1 Tax=Streptomyces silaceus TaxID=545123 RepID=UPI0006EB3D51|nr:phage holin family protein [Streptomyces silaceus]MCF3124508.1 phage holin family protein [Streptomyces arenae]